MVGGQTVLVALAVVVAPVLLVVLVYSVIAVWSMFCVGRRRSHALEVMAGLVDLACVVRPWVVRRRR